MHTPTPTPHTGPVSAPPGLPELEKGAVVGGYLLVEELANGGFGVIWRAEPRGGGTPVAIKILHQHLLVSAEAVARLEREAAAIEAIRHPNVVEVFAHDQLADGRPYIVMELLDGRDLYSHLREHGPMPLPRALEVIEAVCDALSAAHQLGIVHRDVKASNVVLPAGDGSRIVLIDFGLAKLLESQGPELTASRSTIGTPSCISPEQIRSEPVDQRTDVYALGALAYHVLTGEPPFADGTALTIHYMHLYSRRPRPSSRVDVPPVLDEVVARAMAKEPGDRYPSAAAFFEAFAAAIRGERPAPRSGGDTGLVGFYLDVTSAGELTDVDDGFFDDLESVVSQAQAFLADTDLRIAACRNNSALFAAPVAADRLASRAARTRLVDLVTALLAALGERPGRDPRVAVRVVIDAVDAGDDGETQLLETTTRIARVRQPGALFASQRFAYDLDLEIEPVTDAPALVRIR